MFAVVPGKEKPYLLGDGQPFWGAAHYLTNHVGQISPDVRLADRSDVSYYVSQYDGEIRYVDEYLGRFLAALDEGSLGDQAVIVVTSDHG
jgi:arylsulfatase A-like enzyme